MANDIQFGTRKVTVGVLGGALATIIVWRLNESILSTPIPANVTSSLGTVVTAILVYTTPESYGS